LEGIRREAGKPITSSAQDEARLSLSKAPAAVPGIVSAVCLLAGICTLADPVAGLVVPTLVWAPMSSSKEWQSSLVGLSIRSVPGI